MKVLQLFLLFSSVLIILGCGDGAPSANATNVLRPVSTPANSATNSPSNYDKVTQTPQESSANKEYKSANKPANAKPANSNLNPTATPKPTEQPSSSPKPKEEALFSFPPPKPTRFEVVENSKLLNRDGVTTFTDVSAKLSKALEKGGYLADNYSYFWNEDDEFAIVTQMERIGNDGNLSEGDRRWDSSSSLPTAKFGNYFNYLISGKKVFYRVFAFIVTKKSYNFKKNKPPSFEMAQDWMNKGSASFGDGESSTIQSVIYDDKKHRCYALVYLFVNHTSLTIPKSVDSLEESEQSLADGLRREVKQHLEKAGIFFGE